MRSHGLTSVRDFLSGGTVIRTRGRKQNVRLTLDRDGEGLLLYVKRHGPGRGAPGMDEWNHTLAVAAAGIPTAPLAAAGVSAEGSFFATAALVGALPLDDVLRQRQPGPEERQDLIRAAARLTGRLHREGLFHRDLYLCHLFVLPEAESGGPLALIDLERLKQPRVFHWRWKVKDLAALAYASRDGLASTPEQLRFLAAYLPASGTSRGEADTLVRAVQRKVARMIRHNRDRNR